MTNKKKSFDAFGLPILIASIAGVASILFLIIADPQDFFYIQEEKCHQLEPETNIPGADSSGKIKCSSWRWKFRRASPIFSSLSSSFVGSALTIIFFEILLKRFYAEQLDKSIDSLLDKKRTEDSISKISRFYSTADKYHQEIWNSIEIKDKNPGSKAAKIDAIEIHHSVYFLATDKLDLLQKRVQNGWKIRLLVTYLDQSTKDNVDKLRKILQYEIGDTDQKKEGFGYLEIRHYQNVPGPPFFYFNYHDETNESSTSIVRESILFSLFCAAENYSVTPGFSITDPSVKQQFNECFEKLWDEARDDKIILSYREGSTTTNT